MTFTIGHKLSNDTSFLDCSLKLLPFFKDEEQLVSRRHKSSSIAPRMTNKNAFSLCCSSSKDHLSSRWRVFSEIAKMIASGSLDVVTTKLSKSIATGRQVMPTTQGKESTITVRTTDSWQVRWTTHAQSTRVFRQQFHNNCFSGKESFIKVKDCVTKTPFECAVHFLSYLPSHIQQALRI